MKSRFLPLPVTCLTLAACLMAQTQPPAPSPSAPEKTDARPVGPAHAPTDPTAGKAAAPPDNSDDSLTTLKKTVNEVRVIFTVTDRHGRYIKDLQKTDFKVIDDQKPAELRYLQQRNRSSATGRIAGRCQQLGARPLQV
jgi:Ca-activated chloride channel family protein